MMPVSIATPSVPPIWRKNCTLAVATPTTLNGTAFWTTTWSSGSVTPRPSVITIIRAIASARLVCSSTVANENMPAASKTTPTMSRIL